MNIKFIEFKRIIASAFADMVKDEVITEWQAGYFFALLLCYYNDCCDIDFSELEDFTDDSVGFSNFGEQPILNKEIYVKKGVK